jgi:hypothetical protein
VVVSASAKLGGRWGSVYRRPKAAEWWWPVRGGRRAAWSALMAPASWRGGAGDEAGVKQRLGTHASTWGGRCAGTGRARAGCGRGQRRAARPTTGGAAAFRGEYARARTAR